MSQKPILEQLQSLKYSGRLVMWTVSMPRSQLLCFPVQQIGRIHAALFADDVLYLEMLSKASFWLQQKFYGVNISRLYTPSVSSYFSQVCIISSLCIQYVT